MILPVVPCQIDKKFRLCISSPPLVRWRKRRTGLYPINVAQQKLDSMFVVLGTEVLPARWKLHIGSTGWWYICLHEWLISIVSVSKICPNAWILFVRVSLSKLHRWYLHVIWTQVSHEKFKTSATVRTGMSMVLRINGFVHRCISRLYISPVNPSIGEVNQLSNFGY